MVSLPPVEILNSLCCIFFSITTEIHARSLANFLLSICGQTHEFSGGERAIRQVVIVENKFMSVFNASVLLLKINFVITLGDPQLL